MNGGASPDKCEICGVAKKKHERKSCWEFAENAPDAAALFKKRVQAHDQKRKPSWDLVEQAFRMGYAMVNGAWIEHDGKGMR